MRASSFTFGLRYHEVDEEQARGVSKLAHELACDLAATLLSPCTCKAVARDAQLRKRREAWREDGLRRPRRQAKGARLHRRRGGDIHGASPNARRAGARGVMIRAHPRGERDSLER